MHSVENITSPDAAIVHQKRAVGLGVPPKCSIVPDGNTTYRNTDGRGRNAPAQKYTFCSCVKPMFLFRYRRIVNEDFVGEILFFVTVRQWGNKNVFCRIVAVAR